MGLRENSYKADEYAGDFDSLQNHLEDLLVFQIERVAFEDFKTRFGDVTAPVVKDILAVNADGTYEHISGDKGMAIFPMVIARTVKGAHTAFASASEDERQAPYLVGRLTTKGRTYVLDTDLSDDDWKAAESAVASFEDF